MEQQHDRDDIWGDVISASEESTSASPLNTFAATSFFGDESVAPQSSSFSFPSDAFGPVTHQPVQPFTTVSSNSPSVGGAQSLNRTGDFQLPGTMKSSASTQMRTMSSISSTATSISVTSSTEEPLVPTPMGPRAGKRKKINELGASESASLPSASLALVDEPEDNVLSGRSSHQYELQVCGREVSEIKVTLQDQHGKHIEESVTIEDSNAVESGNNDCIVNVYIRVRITPRRLKIMSLRFTTSVVEPSNGEVVILAVKTKKFIVCSHITSQRKAAEEKLAQFANVMTEQTLTQQLVVEYNKFEFQRKLSAPELRYLCLTAFDCSEIELRNKRVACSNLEDFWKWFRGCLKQMQRLRGYWESGAIVGFLSREAALAIVQRHSPGCCLVRVSESVPKAFAVTCKTIDGQMANKLIEKSSCKHWELFVNSLQSFSGGLTKVIDTEDEEALFTDAFTALAVPEDEGSRDGYEEHAGVHEALKKEREDKATVSMSMSSDMETDNLMQ